MGRAAARSFPASEPPSTPAVAWRWAARAVADRRAAAGGRSRRPSLSHETWFNKPGLKNQVLKKPGLKKRGLLIGLNLV